MKKRLIVLAVCMVCMFLMSVSLAQALPQYDVNDTSGRLGSGGPFQIVGYTDPSVNFQTFCIEWNEHISLGGRYYGSIDPLVYYSSGPNSVSSAAIDPNTALLYNYFLDNPGLSNANKALIQEAIWAFQGQLFYGSPSITGNDYYNNISNYHASNRTIMALNLWTTDVGNGPYGGNNNPAYNSRAQSMLIATPEPGILILLSLGLVGVAGIRRKLRS
jgi:hypothetical protein